MTPRAATIEAPTGRAMGSGTNATTGARRIATAFARARAEGRAALIPYVVAGYPDAETSLEIALAAADAGADLLEVGLPYSDPLADGATLQRASGVALGAGATLERSLRLIERIGAARPDLPLVPMGYANQVIGGGDGEAVAKRLAAAGAAGLIVADLTPDEGAPFEAVARAAGLAVVYLVAPTTPPARRAAVAARSGGFLYCVSLVGVTGARTTLPATVGRLVREVKAVSPVPVARRLRREPASPRSCHREGRRRWRHRGLGAGRCPRARRPGRRIAGASGPTTSRPPPRSCRVPVPESIAVTIEATPKKAFATAIDWPGWSRSGKTEELALEALAAAGPRYATVAQRGGRVVPGAVERSRRFRGRGAHRRRGRHRVRRPVLDHRPRSKAPSTGQGSNAAAPDSSRRPGRSSTASPLGAPAELRKGPRGGGRDRDKMIGHVVEADSAYAREIGIRQQPPDPTDRPAIEAMRAAMLEVLRQPTDGSPIAERKWTTRYAARRIAWHALDHAWEMEDRTEA